jgi:general secretion pathway protein M
MTLRERFEKLEPRERRLLVILGSILGAFLFLLGPIAVYGAVAGKRTENQDLRDLIDKIYDARAQIAERKAKKDALLARYAKTAPPLAGFIEEATKENGVSAAESQDRPEIPHGKRYTERSTVVKIHKLGMLALAKTLEKIEQSGYPVAVTRLNVKPRSGEPDSYEVEIGVSAYDRKADAPAAGAAASASPSASASADKEKDQ